MGRKKSGGTISDGTCDGEDDLGEIGAGVCGDVDEEEKGRGAVKIMLTR